MMVFFDFKYNSFFSILKNLFFLELISRMKVAKEPFWKRLSQDTGLSQEELHLHVPAMSDPRSGFSFLKTFDQGGTFRSSREPVFALKPLYRVSSLLGTATQ